MVVAQLLFRSVQEVLSVEAWDLMWFDNFRIYLWIAKCCYT